MSYSEIIDIIKKGLECKPAVEDLICWNNLCAECVAPVADCAPLQYKVDFNLYQEKYFQEVYEEYRDISLILNRGGRPVGIWPLAYYIQNGKLNLCSSGGADSSAYFTPSSQNRSETCGLRAVPIGIVRIVQAV